MKDHLGFSTRLLIFNGLAILAAILNHSAILAFVAMERTPGGFDQMSSLTYYTLRMIEQVIIFAIPVFFFISGYFISFAIERIESNKQWKVVFVRIKNLMIPFLFWSVLIVLLDMLLGAPHSVGSFLLRVITGRAAGPYYFVLTLVQYLILSPLLVSLARKKYKLLLILTAVIQLAAVGMRYDTLLGLDLPVLQPIHFLDSQRFFPSRIFFFSLGIVYGMHFSRSKEFRQRLVRARWRLFAASIAFFILGTIEWELLQTSSSDPSTFIFQLETYTDNFYALTFILSYLAFDEFAPPFPKQFEILGGLSYGIYLTHWSVQEYTSKFIYHFLPWVVSYQIIMQPILIICGLGLPLLLMSMVKRSPIRYSYRYLFG